MAEAPNIRLSNFMGQIAHVRCAALKWRRALKDRKAFVAELIAAEDGMSQLEISRAVKDEFGIGLKRLFLPCSDAKWPTMTTLAVSSRAKVSTIRR